VETRGNQQPPVFWDGRDRRLWLENLAEVCQKTGLAPLDAKPNNVRRLDALILQGDEVPAPEPNPLFD
jgi:hypothetical protein